MKKATLLVTEKSKEDALREKERRKFHNEMVRVVYGRRCSLCGCMVYGGKCCDICEEMFKTDVDGSS